LKSCCVLRHHYDDERNKTMLHNTTPDLQDQDQDRFCFGLRPVLSWSGGLRPHHWYKTKLTHEGKNHDLLGGGKIECAFMPADRPSDVCRDQRRRRFIAQLLSISEIRRSRDRYESEVEGT